MAGQPAAGGAQSAVLIERIGNLQIDVTDIKSGLVCLNASQEKLERMYLVEHQKVVSSTERAHQRIDVNERQIHEMTEQIVRLEKTIQPLITSNRIITWVGSILGGSIVILIWMIITGQVQLIYP